MSHEESLKLTERGWPGHFILADRCLFRRNTLVELGSDRVVVSTVGRMRTQDGRTFDTVGMDRSFETMAFTAVMENGYWEADVGNEISLPNQQWQLSGYEPERSGEANKMHDAYVSAICSMLTTKEHK